MILGLPCQDQHEMTEKTFAHLAKTATPDLHVVLVDNASEEPYQIKDYPFKFSVLRNEVNRGYYYPLLQLYEKYKDEHDLIGLMHNDLWLYEKDWDARMTQCFTNDPLLSVVGLCGSNEADQAGGRGSGTKCFFRGEIGGIGQATGTRIYDLWPAVIYDSLFMMFRVSAIPLLMKDQEEWDNVTLAHFYDRIWPLRLVERGLHAGVLGVEVDHWGGTTLMANMKYHLQCIDWLNERNIPFENPETEMYLEAERRYLSEYRDTKHFIPCMIDPGYRYHKT